MKVYDKNIAGWGNFPERKTKVVSPNFRFIMPEMLVGF